MVWLTSHISGKDQLKKKKSTKKVFLSGDVGWVEGAETFPPEGTVLTDSNKTQHS